MLSKGKMGVRKDTYLVIHVHCPECGRCLCVGETGSRQDTLLERTPEGTYVLRNFPPSQVHVHEGCVVDAESEE